jgi:hypothetical protein
LDGKLTPQYGVNCGESLCENNALGLGETIKSAEIELKRSYGWAKVRGLWYCPEHIDGARNSQSGE